jgi:ABC-2 type transport system ATP-binding protein
VLLLAWMARSFRHRLDPFRVSKEIRRRERLPWVVSSGVTVSRFCFFQISLLSAADHNPGIMAATMTVGGSHAQSGTGDVVLRAEDLAKTFRLGFLRRRVDAVRGISFAVNRGEIFGFLGPNGAGKTTTMKIMTGLIFPSRGRAEVFGLPAGSPAAKRRLGYLPETPYFYEYLTPEEFLDFAGAISDIPGPERRRRADRLIARVGLEHARGRPLRKFSKGMLQRIGIAQALMGDPELVILDEPMTGLDPIGRKEIRDLILELRHEGKTVFFSTHILPDVESTCDRVAIVVGGRLRSVGPLTSLLSTRLLTTEVVLRPAPSTTAAAPRLSSTADAHAGPLLPSTADALAALRLPPLPDGARCLAGGAGIDVALEMPSGADIDGFLRAALAGGASVISVTPRRESLEDLFVREAGTREVQAGTHEVQTGTREEGRAPS